MATRTGGLVRTFASVLLCAPAVSLAAVDVEQLIRDLATQNVTPALDDDVDSFPDNVKHLIAEPKISRKVMAAWSPTADALIRANLALILAMRLERDPEELKPKDWAEFFLPRLDDESPLVRIEAARAFSTVRYSSAEPKLARVLEADQDTTVAFAAAVALSRQAEQATFIVAGEAGRRDVLAMIVERGFDLEAEINDAGWRAVTFAAAEGRLQTTRLLLELGANPNATNDLGRTGLMFASSYGYADIVEVLLAAGADPNLVPTDSDGFPALIVAAQNGQAAVVAMLLRNGADVDIQDKKGRTALDWALQNEHDEVAESLRSRGRVGD